MDFSKIDLSKFQHSMPIQIRFVDIDLAGHVNNATLLSYFETERVAFFNELIGKTNNWKQRGLVIARTEIDYVKSIYLDDKIKVYSRISHLGTKSFKVENVLMKEENGIEVLASIASFVIVCIDAEKNITIEIPQEWKDKMKV